MRRSICRIVVTCVLALPLLPPPSGSSFAQAGMTDAEIRSVLQQRIDLAKQSVGIVVGLVDDKGTRVIGYGKTDQPGGQAVNGDSVFEIGSVTKVFTATILDQPKERKSIKLDPKIFDTYIGEYQLAPTFSITISREGDRCFGQATGQQKFEIFAESETEFYLQAVNAQITFVKDEKGQVTHLILHQGGADQQGKKIK